MILRSLALTAALLLPAVPAQGQALRRPSTKAFPFSVTPFIGVAWGGQRATQTPVEEACTTDCIRHKVGIGPHVGLELQMPLVGNFGFGVTASGGRPTQVQCDLQCVSPQRLTSIHGAAYILWRFKARAPIYFGLGAAMHYLNPGAVPGQGSVTEMGGSAVLAYDFTLSPRVGGRFGWWNYFLKPSAKDLTIPPYAVSNFVWDTQIGLGIRFAVGGP
jgi:hypothetical protein